MENKAGKMLILGRIRWKIKKKTNIDNSCIIAMFRQIIKSSPNRFFCHRHLEVHWRFINVKSELPVPIVNEHDRREYFFLILGSYFKERYSSKTWKLLAFLFLPLSLMTVVVFKLELHSISRWKIQYAVYSMYYA